MDYWPARVHEKTNATTAIAATVVGTVGTSGTHGAVVGSYTDHHTPKLTVNLQDEGTKKGMERFISIGTQAYCEQPLEQFCRHSG